MGDGWWCETWFSWKSRHLLVLFTIKKMGFAWKFISTNASKLLWSCGLLSQCFTWKLCLNQPKQSLFELKIGWFLIKLILTRKLTVRTLVIMGLPSCLPTTLISTGKWNIFGENCYEELYIILISTVNPLAVEIFPPLRPTAEKVIANCHTAKAMEVLFGQRKICLRNDHLVIQIAYSWW